MSTSTVYIAIEAHVADEEIRGQIRSGAGPPGSFSGWLSLITALDALLSPGVRDDRLGDVREGPGRVPVRPSTGSAAPKAAP